ncbi:MAG: winged helix-turn-helix transcriptional regulator [Candidatus Eisenbacteria sp.]|nr:winged helix-turn-helix transcriptional regulator [Candidatus Eisenbacteria bacterium]
MSSGAGAPPEAFEKAADLLRALSHPVRLRIIELLRGGELCVKRLEEILEVSQSSVSQHLTRLRYAGLIESERKGHLVCYRLVKGGAARILEAAMDESRQKSLGEKGS